MSAHVHGCRYSHTPGGGWVERGEGCAAPEDHRPPETDPRLQACERELAEGCRLFRMPLRPGISLEEAFEERRAWGRRVEEILGLPRAREPERVMPPDVR